MNQNLSKLAIELLDTKNRVLAYTGPSKEMAQKMTEDAENLVRKSCLFS